MGDKRRFWIGFNRVLGIGPARVQKLLDAFGDLEAAWNASREELRAAGLGPKTIEALLDTRYRLDLDQEIAQVDRYGFKIMTWEDEDYPPRLREIHAPPPMLYVWGEVRDEDRYAVAVVGTRRATAYGKAIARDVATILAASGVTVVSGLARGIDSIAHRAALDAGGRTLAVLGSGLDQLYPPEHRSLAESIAAQGAVFSDYPLGTRPEPKNFPPRNRIISGLSLIVVVIEAGEGSGALITADFAVEQGRDVFAVPGDIHRPASRGTNRLIRLGAHPLLSPDDVMEALNLDLIARQELVPTRIPEDETERRILEALSNEPLHVDEIQRRCGLPVSQITASLALLELKGHASQVGGMHYILAREPSATYRVE
ncbi:MAG TPA: DNA-protecting protein DprA [Anaerolineae bacterium]|nr:DNA-protecting protein DprA [Anaerolineae bacterium]